MVLVGFAPALFSRRNVTTSMPFLRQRYTESSRWMKRQRLKRSISLFYFLRLPEFSEMSARLTTRTPTLLWTPSRFVAKRRKFEESAMVGLSRLIGQCGKVWAWLSHGKMLRLNSNRLVFSSCPAEMESSYLRRLLELENHSWSHSGEIPSGLRLF